ncbi:hypothetical protein HOG98_05775 [bacterium]|jgi:hypothetical protein|nr:hypothetical protein [bacterium]
MNKICSMKNEGVNLFSNGSNGNGRLFLSEEVSIVSTISNNGLNCASLSDGTVCLYGKYIPEGKIVCLPEEKAVKTFYATENSACIILNDDTSVTFKVREIRETKIETDSLIPDGVSVEKVYSDRNLYCARLSDGTAHIYGEKCPKGKIVDLPDTVSIDIFRASENGACIIFDDNTLMIVSSSETINHDLKIEMSVPEGIEIKHVLSDNDVYCVCLSNHQIHMYGLDHTKEKIIDRSELIGFGEKINGFYGNKNVAVICYENWHDAQNSSIYNLTKDLELQIRDTNVQGYIDIDTLDNYGANLDSIGGDEIQVVSSTKYKNVKFDTLSDGRILISGRIIDKKNPIKVPQNRAGYFPQEKTAFGEYQNDGNFHVYTSYQLKPILITFPAEGLVPIAINVKKSGIDFQFRNGENVSIAFNY